MIGFLAGALTLPLPFLALLMGLGAILGASFLGGILPVFYLVALSVPASGACSGSPSASYSGS